MSKKLSILFLLCLSFAWFACKKVDIQFGSEFLDNGYTQIHKIDSFSADLSTVYVDSFATNGLGVTLIGGYSDPAFGKVSVKNYFEIAPSFPIVADSFFNTIFDSVALLIKPDKSYYGDTTKPVHADVYRLNQNITPFDANLNVLYNTQNFNVDAAPLGSKDFRVYPQRADSIKIRLDDNFGKTLLTKLKTPGDGDLQSADFFLQYLKGLRISSPANSQLLFGAKDSMVVRVYYKLPGLYLLNKSVDFVMSNNSHHFNNIAVDRSGTPLKDLPVLKQLPSSVTGNMAYSSFTTGAMAKIRFPSVRDLYKIPNFAKVLKATLVVRPVRGSYNLTTLRLPPQLRLSSTTMANAVGTDLAIVVDGMATAQTGNLVIDDLLGDNTNYTYDVTGYVQNLMLDASINGNGLLLIPPSPAMQTNFNRIVVGNRNQPVNSRVELLIIYATVQ